MQAPACGLLGEAHRLDALDTYMYNMWNERYGHVLCKSEVKSLADIFSCMYRTMKEKEERKDEKQK